MLKEKKYLKDNIASMLFVSSSCRGYVEEIISKAIGIDKNIVKDNLILQTPRVNSNANVQYSYVDAIYENNTSIINIEINYTKNSNNKNLKYVCHMLLKQTIIGKKIDLKSIYQININNFDIFDDNEFLSKSYITKEHTSKIRDKSICIIDINLEYLSKIDYNTIRREPNSLEYLLYIFVNDNKSELNKLYLDNEIMEQVQNKLEEFTKEFDSLLYYDYDEYHNEMMYNEGKNDGLEEGQTKKAKEIAKNLLKLNISIDDIITATGLSKEEILKLKSED